MSEARSKLVGGKLSEVPWGDSRVGGTALDATFSQHRVRVYFWKGKALTTFVEVLSQ